MVTWLQAIGSPHVRSGKYWQQYRKQSPKVAVRDPETGIPQAVERVHWDNFMAAEIGMPAAYDYGSQRGGYATYFATNWVGDDGWVAELDFQFRGMFFNGDVFHISGNVVDKWRGRQTGTGYVKIEFHSINNRGQDIMPGFGIMALPSKVNGPVEFPVDVRADGRDTDRRPSSSTAHRHDACAKRDQLRSRCGTVGRIGERRVMWPTLTAHRGTRPVPAEVRREGSSFV